jgi:predicted chitinase
MDMTTFFAYARRAPFGGRLVQSQINGINVILDQWRFYRLVEREWLAYILATVFHETAGTMQPVRETLKSTDAKAIAALDKAFASGRLKTVKTPYWRRDKAGKSWLGRGFVQLTHERNYKAMGERLKVDLAGNPSLAMDPVISAKILIVGMAEGLFTGKKLSDYLGRGKVQDPEGARRIINGTDKAKLIAGYYKSFLDAIEAAEKAERAGSIPADVRPDAARADNVPAAQSKTVWTVASGLLASGGFGVARDIANGGASFFSAISNPWAFCSLAFLSVACLAFFWLVSSGRVVINRAR